jgi:uncharacterized protein YukE
MDCVWLTGDPGGMRALAGSLRGFASGIEALQGEGDGDVAAMTFEGPAGDSFRARMQRASKAGSQAAGQLRDLAATLESAASQVEAAQAEQAREEQARIEAEQAAARRAAAARAGS